MKNVEAIVRVSGVTVYIGHTKRMKAIPGRHLKLGSVATRYLVEDYKVTNSKFDVYADLDQCIEICGFPGVRNDWEKNLRLMLGVDPNFRSLGPEGTTDWFVVRLNPTNKLFRMGWKDQTIDMRKEMKRVYL